MLIRIGSYAVIMCKGWYACGQRLEGNMNSKINVFVKMVKLWVDFMFSTNEPLLWKPSSVLVFQWSWRSCTSLSCLPGTLPVSASLSPSPLSCAGVPCFKYVAVLVPFRCTLPQTRCSFVFLNLRVEPLMYFLSVDLPVWDVFCKWTWTVCALWWLASLTWPDVFEVYQGSSMYQYLTPLSCWKVFHHMHVPPFCLFIH